MSYLTQRQIKLNLKKKPQEVEVKTRDKTYEMIHWRHWFLYIFSYLKLSDSATFAIFICDSVVFTLRSQVCLKNRWTLCSIQRVWQLQSGLLRKWEMQKSTWRRICPQRQQLVVKNAHVLTMVVFPFSATLASWPYDHVQRVRFFCSICTHNKWMTL